MTEMGAFDSGEHGGNDAPPETTTTTSSNWSRVNGWSWPPHPFQVIAWAVVIYIAVFFYLTAIPALVFAAQIACYVVSLPSTFEKIRTFRPFDVLLSSRFAPKTFRPLCYFVSPTTLNPSMMMMMRW